MVNPTNEDNLESLEAELLRLLNEVKSIRIRLRLNRDVETCTEVEELLLRATSFAKTGNIEPAFEFFQNALILLEDIGSRVTGQRHPFV